MKCDPCELRKKATGSMRLAARIDTFAHFNLTSQLTALAGCYLLESISNRDSSNLRISILDLRESSH